MCNYKSCNSKAQKAQAEALKALEENTGTTGVSKTTSSLSDNTSTKRNGLSALVKSAADLPFEEEEELPLRRVK